MCDLALVVGLEDTELSKTLIRGHPTRLKWHVVSFNPTTLSETRQYNVYYWVNLHYHLMTMNILML